MVPPLRKKRKKWKSTNAITQKKKEDKCLKRLKKNNSNTKIVGKNVNKKRKLSFKDTYDLKNLPVQIEKLERELKEYEIILNKKDLYQKDRKTFDNTAIKITNIKNKQYFSPT